jgi:hypothetical protein
MGVLGLSPQSTDESLAQARPAQEFPAGFTEAFDASWQEGRLFRQSISRDNARQTVLDDYDDRVRQAGGDVDAELHKLHRIGGEFTDADRLTAINRALIAAQEKDSKIDIHAMDDTAIELAAIAKSREALEVQQQIAARGMTGGGRAGGILGGLTAAAADPVNIAGMLFAPAEGLGVLQTGLRWGGIAGANQAAIEAAAAPYHEAVQPGYGAGPEAPRAILEAAVTGGVGGGALKIAANTWTRVLTGAWPRSVRDAGNVVSSQAHTVNSNIYNGAAGEAAHSEALKSAIDSVLAGRAINVENIITPEIETRSRSLIAGLEAERRLAMPIFDERSIRIAAEEAGLRARDVRLTGDLAAMPAGDVAAADRLNRLEAVDEQLARTTELGERRALEQRRDQILVDTTPEELRKRAGPIEQRRLAESERNQIAGRLDEIRREREQIAAENLGRVQPLLLGQTEPVRLYKAIADTAAAGGHIITPDEVRQIASRLVGLDPQMLADAEKMIQHAPHQVAQGYQRFVDHDAIPRSSPAVDKMLQQAVETAPEMQAALRADLDRERAMGDVDVHMGTEDAPVKQSLDSLLDEIDNERIAADEIEACANPAPEPAEKAA